MVGHRHYFQIAFGLFMEKKFLSETIKKDSSYVFPGFCTGCRRSGLCYGCERSALPHTHRDYQSRTGGGFTYWKHDRAESEISGNNPKNWRLHTTSSSGDAISRTKSAATAGSSVEVYFVDGKKRLVLGNDGGVPLDDQTIEELCTMKIWDNIIDSDCDHVLYQDESGVEILIHKNNLQQILALMPLNHPDRQKILNLLDTESQSSKRLSITLDVASRMGTMTPSSLGGMSDEKGHLMDFIETLERRRSSSIDSKNEGSSASRKDSLYKAPKAFKLKARERKQLIAQSPFSTNRQYDIPKGPGFNIQKSTKELTQFVNVKKRDGNWEEPEKFELQKYERENADFIRRQKNGDNTRNMNGHHDDEEVDRDRHNRVLNRLDAPLSPDSGLDSEFMADSVKGQTVDSDGDDITKMKSLDDAERENGYFSTRTGISDGYSDFGRKIDDHKRVKSGREETGGSLNGETDVMSRKERKKRDIIKKTRQVEGSPFSRSPTKSLPTDDERELSFVFEKRKDSDTGIKDVLGLPSPHVTMTTPDLPQLEQRRQEESKKKNVKYRVKAPPVMKQPPDPPKIRNPPPKIRTL
ncbi:uncharacterized protein LOC126809462 [Patella vulgata]|uniref:uncharacterized protein LOC126809462 n=1 Tax=Patella vulgata TaxID=6465 RepID=UPI0024A7D292|nr:uncharacterized protein LOC126809462 [Patella vulgata]